MSARRTCSIEGCERPYSAKGFCSVHYMRWRDKGDPQAQVRIFHDNAARWRSYVQEGSEEECWLWLGRPNGDGYGLFRWLEDGREHGTTAHRYGYQLLVGPVPADLEVDHLCRVPLCVNPAHLEPVTHAENIRRRDEAMGRGRS